MFLFWLLNANVDITCHIATHNGSSLLSFKVKWQYLLILSRLRRWSNVVYMLRKCVVFAGYTGSFVSTGACNLEVPGSNPGRAGYLLSWLCIYSDPICSPGYGVYSAVYGTVHYKEPLKSFEIRVGHNLGFGLPSVAILPQCAESDVKQ